MHQPDAVRQRVPPDNKKVVTRRLVGGLIWATVAGLSLWPVLIAAASPYIVGRSAIYIAAGLAGALSLTLLFVQPLLAAGLLPGLRGLRGRRWHRVAGFLIAAVVAVHIGGLYITSPPDALDALLLVSPTPFSIYGVVAMWGLVLTVLLVAFRKHLRLRPLAWRIIHNALAASVVATSAAHALLIEGTMGTLSKIVLCICAVLTTAAVTLYLRVIKPLRQRRASAQRAHRAAPDLSAKS
ncbi:ferric reductase-like transmembrane domain-containing protein [Labrenzia sp. CE80]|uniref:ferric reductase-like transmembrane domain-containing protein n=1 Tax=Labrenzia sp. CE80 TaxID=1788986 RepID=UPI001AD90E50|nr:ferric reductase-like transmembrane domain-containing protein [Labrenzia sp. CE80]